MAINGDKLDKGKQKQSTESSVVSLRNNCALLTVMGKSLG